MLRMASRGAAARSAPDLRCRLQHMLDVVEHQQQLPLAERLSQPRTRRIVAPVGEAERRGDGREDHGGIAQRRQVHEGHAVGEGGRHPFGRRDGQPGLAHAAGAAEGQQSYPSPLQQVRNRRDVVLAPDQSREWARQRPR